jgi:hypothetical protein
MNHLGPTCLRTNAKPPANASVRGLLHAPAPPDPVQFIDWNPADEYPPLPAVSTKGQKKTGSQKSMRLEDYRKHSQLPDVLATCRSDPPTTAAEAAERPQRRRAAIEKPLQRQVSDSDDGVTSPLGRLRPTTMQASTSHQAEQDELQSLLERELLADTSEAPHSPQTQHPQPSALRQERTEPQQQRKRQRTEPGPTKPPDIAMTVPGPGGAAATLAVAELSRHDAEEEEEGEKGWQGETIAIREQSTEAGLKAVGFVLFEQLQAAVLAKAREQKASAMAECVASHGRRPNRGKSKRKKEIVQPTLDNILNPMTDVYHPEFAAAYQSTRDGLLRLAGKRRRTSQRVHVVETEIEAPAEPPSSLLAGQRWSDLTRDEHEWYLEHQFLALKGTDAGLFNSLNRRVRAEQRVYSAAVEAALQSLWMSGRFDHLTERQGAQLQDDRKRQRQRALTLPRFYSLTRALRLESVDHVNGVSFPKLSFQREVWQRGEPPLLHRKPSGTPLPGNKRYLPAVLPQGDASSTAALQGVYRRNATPEVSQDDELLTATTDPAKQPCFVAAAGAVERLLSSGMLRHSELWEIPVVVKENGIVYLDKPLAMLKERTRDKQRRLQKYAVLSAALHPMQGEDRASPRANIPAARETCLNEFQLGQFLLLVRSHGRVQVCEQQPNRQDGDAEIPPMQMNGQLGMRDGAFAVLALKIDYLPEPEQEQDTPDELVSWWCKLLLNPAAQRVEVPRVRVPLGLLADWRSLTASEIERQWSDETDPRAGFKFLANLFATLRSLATGRYLIVCRPDEKDMSRNSVVIAPHAEHRGADEVALDVHAEHAASGEVDLSKSPIVMPRWRPANSDVHQIPHTYTPKPAGAKASVEASGKRREGRGKGRRTTRGNGDAGEVWQGDVDAVEHVHVSREEYEAGLAAGL